MTKPRLLAPVAVLLAAGLVWAAPPARSTVTVIGFSDYHAHAVPFFSEGKPNQAGIARAVAYLKAARARPGTLVFSGGDMLNKGAPTWSDEYRCRDWSFLRGLVDAMALGNHDLDYGPEEFEACRAALGAPVLAANLVTAEGGPALPAGDGKPYRVFEAGGVRVGAFAVAGADVQSLVRREDLPAGARWADATETARAVVRELRADARVSAVVLIGHQQREEDFALARAVPGIDLILGTHAHLKQELSRIPDTATWFISPYQYLAYLSEVRLQFEGGRLARVEGGLVKLDEKRPEDPELAAEVTRLQAELARKRPDRFAVLGRAAAALSDAGVTTGESQIGNWATDILRAAASAHVFFSTASSFRSGLAPGPVSVEDLKAVLPYTNEIVVAELTGRQLLDWLALAVERRGSNGFCAQSGLRYAIRGDRPESVEVLAAPDDPDAGYVRLDPGAAYLVATTDYQAYKADGYRELFAQAKDPKRTGLDVQHLLAAALASEPASAKLDGRVR